MKLMRNKKVFLTIGINIIIVILSLICYFYASKNMPKVNYSLADIANWKASYVEADNSSIYISENFMDSGEQINMIWGPYVPLSRGSYSVDVIYETDSDQTIFASASGEEANLIESSNGILNYHSNNITYQFEARDYISQFQLIIKYSGYGHLRINSITIKSNNNQIKRNLTETIALLFIADIIILVSGWSREKKRIAIILTGVTLLISLPLAMRFSLDADDIQIHYLRIEAIVQALRSKQFPARISSVSQYGLGYPFSIYYNDIFLYFPAVLRLLGFSVNTAYKLYVFSINLLTVYLSYFSFKGIFKSKKTSIVLTILYSAASYRILNVYERAAVGEFTAQAFLPLGALAIHRIFSDEENHYKRILQNSLLLTAAMSGIIGSHILTTLLSVFFLAIFCVIKWRKTFRHETLLSLCLAMILTFMVNLYFLVPLVDYYINVPAIISTDKTPKLIQYKGIALAQLFAFSQNLNGTGQYIVTGRSQFTPGFPLMIIFLIAMGCRFYLSGHKRYDLLLAFSGMSVLFASDIFPWNFLILHSKIWRIISSIQFPYRFLSFSVLFLTLLAGQLLTDFHLIPYHIVLAAAAVFMMFWFTGNLLNFGETLWIYDTASLHRELTGTIYFLEGTNKFDLVNGYDVGIKNNAIEGEHMEKMEILSQNSYSLRFYGRTDNTLEKHIVTVPVFNYKGYHAFDESGNEFPLAYGKQNLITFELPDEFDGVVTVAFVDPPYWTAALLFSTVITLLLVCGYACYDLRGKRNPTKK